MNNFKHTLKCPISQQYFLNPVITDDGITYEKFYIKNWLKQTPVSPISRKRTLVKSIRKNIIVKNIMEDLYKQYPEKYANRLNYANNSNVVQKLLAKNKFRKLLSYNKYDLKLLNNERIDDMSCLDYIIEKCTDKEVLNHFIDNLVDINCHINGCNLVNRIISHFNIWIDEDTNKFLLKKILDSNFDINKPDSVYGYSLIFLMRIKKYSDIAKSVIAAGNDVNIINPPNLRWYRVFHCRALAAHCSQPKNDLKIAVKNAYPLHFAMKFHKDAVVKLLIEKGADIEATTIGYRPLELAILQLKTNIITLLIEKGACLEYSDRMGKTQPVHLLFKSAKLLPFVKIFHQRGVNFCGAIFHAIHYQNVPGVKFLIEIGADINEVDHLGCSPIFRAIAIGNKIIINMLMRENVFLDVNYINKTDGFKILHYAIKNNCSMEVIETIINKGADPNSLTNEGWSPIHYAVKQSNLPLVKLLVSKGVDLNTITTHKWRPIDIAVKYSTATIILFLLAKKVSLDGTNSCNKSTLDLIKKYTPTIIHLI